MRIQAAVLELDAPFIKGGNLGPMLQKLGPGVSPIIPLHMQTLLSGI